VYEFAVVLLEQAQAYSAVEALAVILAVLYLLLAIQQNIWCWVCAAISTAIFAWLFFGVALYMEAALNLFYFAMAVYGWMQWRRGTDDQSSLPVVVWPARIHAVAILAVVLLSLSSGYILDTRSNAAFPYIDSLTSYAAVWATFLVARKVLENWWYWLLIDATMVYVFWAKDLEFTAVLYIVYLLLIPVGLLSWTRSYREAAA
jgi:nicotinamide mononucleotide transporter